MEKQYIIAEIGQAHDGSLGILHSYIDALANFGVDAIKFQTHIAKAESSKHEPFRVNFSYQDQTRFDYWKRMEFSFGQWKGIKEHCEQRNIEFLSSPFSIAAVDLLEKLGVQKYKVGSGEVTNLLLLHKLNSINKPVILSSGMSSFSELDRAVDMFKDKTNLSILQCTTAYPTRPENWGLNVIEELKARYDLPVGFSDHSGDIYACLAAAVLGASIFEFHVVFHKQMFGPDTQASILIDDVPRLVKGIKQIHKALNYKVDKNNLINYKNVKQLFEKSLAINKDLIAGHILSDNDLETKKPFGHGINVTEFSKVLGKRLKSNMKQWDFLNWKDIDE